MTGLLTARQVAELLDVSTETVLRWTRRGELPASGCPAAPSTTARPISTRGSAHARQLPTPPILKEI